MRYGLSNLSNLSTSKLRAIYLAAFEVYRTHYAGTSNPCDTMREFNATVREFANDRTDAAALTAIAVDLAAVTASRTLVQISPETLEWGGFLSGDVVVDDRGERALRARLLAA